MKERNINFPFFEIRVAIVPELFGRANPLFGLGGILYSSRPIKIHPLHATATAEPFSGRPLNFESVVELYILHNKE